jgi:TonB family protein
MTGVAVVVKKTRSLIKRCVLPMRLLSVTVVLAMVATVAATGQTDGKAAFVSEAVARGLVRYKVDPEYPATARQFKISGDVVAQVTIGPDGKVENVGEAKGNMILQGSVKAVLRKWVFNPYFVEGKPARVTTSLSFTFRL